MLTEVCHNVATEPSLQPISAETFPNATANTADNARLDVKAWGFWCRGQDTYFDVRVYFLMLPVTAHSASVLLISATRMPRNVNMVSVLGKLNMESLLHLWCYNLHRWYGPGSEASVFYKRLADLLCSHWDHSYSSSIHWLRCRLSFALLRSSILCILTWKQVFCAQTCKGATGLVRGPGGEPAQ